MIDLKQLAGDRFRIGLDESAKADPTRAERLWQCVIPCRFGTISVHGPETLAAFTGSRRKAAKLAAMPGVEVHQRGDDEIRVLFAPKMLDAVATLLKAKRKRQASPAQLERLAAGRAVLSASREREMAAP